MCDDNSEFGAMPDSDCRVSGRLADDKDVNPENGVHTIQLVIINMDQFSELDLPSLRRRQMFIDT